MMAAEPSIAKLIVKQLHQELSPEEQATLDAWLDESPENRAFMAMNTQPDVLAEGLQVLLGRDDAAIIKRLEMLRSGKLAGSGQKGRQFKERAQSKEERRQYGEKRAQSRENSGRSREEWTQASEEGGRSREERMQSREDGGRSREERGQDSEEKTQFQDEKTQSKDKKTRSKDENAQSRKVEIRKLTKVRTLIGMAAAAAAIVFCVVGYGWINAGFGWNKKPGAETTALLPAKAIAAVENASGRSRAILTLMNGQQIGLDTVRPGVVAVEGGVKIFKNKVGAIVYEAVGQKETAAEMQGIGETAGSGIVGKNIVYHSISVPAGAVYRVTLTDGTTVQLNTGSSMRYPVGLVAGKRMAEVKGEAFFQVAKDATHPFIVQTGKTEIDVLGTAFNLRAYPNEPVQRTTLTEGSVAVHNSGKRVLLSPGEEASSERGVAGIRVEAATDMRRRLAWTNHSPDSNYLSFDKAHLEETMWTIVQWYGLKGFMFTNGAEHAKFGEGTVELGLPLPVLLQFLRRPDLEINIANNILVINMRS